MAELLLILDGLCLGSSLHPSTTDPLEDQKIESDVRQRKPSIPQLPFATRFLLLHPIPPAFSHIALMDISLIMLRLPLELPRDRDSA